MVQQTRIAKQLGISLEECRNLSIYEYYLFLESILLEQNKSDTDNG